MEKIKEIEKANKIQEKDKEDKTLHKTMVMEQVGMERLETEKESPKTTNPPTPATCAKMNIVSTNVLNTFHWTQLNASIWQRN